MKRIAEALIELRSNAGFFSHSNKLLGSLNTSLGILIFKVLFWLLGGVLLSAKLNLLC